MKRLRDQMFGAGQHWNRFAWKSSCLLSLRTIEGQKITPTLYMYRGLKFNIPKLFPIFMHTFYKNSSHLSLWTIKGRKFTPTTYVQRPWNIKYLKCFHFLRTCFKKCSILLHSNLPKRKKEKIKKTIIPEHATGYFIGGTLDSCAK